MKKIFLFLICILFTERSISQTMSIDDKDSRFITYCDDIWAKNIQNFGYKINGRLYDYSKIEDVRDSVLHNLTNLRKIYTQKAFNTVSYDYYYFTDKNFKKFIDFINAIPVTKESYFAYIDKIFDNLKFLKQPNQIEYLIDRFSTRFKFVIDDSVANDFSKRISKETKNLDSAQIHTPLFDRIKQSLLLAEYKSKTDLPHSIYIYANALIMFDSLKKRKELAQVANAVGELYKTIDNPIYAKRSLSYFYDAAVQYLRQKDTVNYAISQMQVSLVITSKSNFYNRLTNRFDILNNYKNNIGVPRAMLIGESEYENNKAQSQDISVHKSIAYFTNNRLSGKLTPIDSSIMLYTLLGQYFDSKNDRDYAKVAISYYSQVCILSTLDTANVNLSNIFSSLMRLSEVYLIDKKSNNAMKCVDQAIKLASIVKDNLALARLNEQKGRILSFYGQKDSALTYVYYALGIADQNAFYPIELNELKKNAYSELFQIYSFNTERDSVIKYREKLAAIDQRYQEDLNDTKPIEDNLNLVFNTRVLNAQNQEIKLKGNQLDSLILLVGLKNMLLVKRDDSLSQINKKISIANEEVFSLGKQKKQLNSDVRQANAQVKELNVSKTHIINWGLLTLFLTSLAWSAYTIRAKRIKDRLLFTKLLLDNDSRSTYHNIRYYYNKFMLYVVNKDFDTASDYAYKSANYLGECLDKLDWDDKHWSIAHEMKLLNSLYEIILVTGTKVKITPTYDRDNIDLNTTRCISDILPILLQNSIKAFDNSNGCCELKIKIRRHNALVFFEVSDNSTPSTIDSYINPKKMNKGLSLLKRKIEYVCKIEHVNLHKSKPFTIELGSGTTIKFIIPYARTA